MAVKSFIVQAPGLLNGPSQSYPLRKTSEYVIRKRLSKEKMEQACLKNVNNLLNTNIYSYLETSGGQSSNPYLNVVDLSTPELIRNLWQLKTAVFLHWCLKCAVSLDT
jgi:hypothetical protein